MRKIQMQIPPPVARALSILMKSGSDLPLWSDTTWVDVEEARERYPMETYRIVEVSDERA